MQYTLYKKENNKGEDIKQYEVDFTVKYTKELTKKDKEKIYKIVRIIDSLGNDNNEETSDEEYRFQTDNDNGENILDGVVVKLS
jgi:patatin-like phospholipase/acyl hydrolase